MQSNSSEQSLRQQLEEHEQEHVLEWLSQLDQRGREALLEQLRELDFERLEKFRTLIEAPTTEISFDDIRPAPVERLPENEEEDQREEHIRELGREALAADRVAALTVAGGQGTRLGYDHPKGTYPITPIRKMTLFEHFAEHIRAARERYGCELPWLIMTSPVNHEETLGFFRSNDYFELPEEKVRLFPQRTNPILDEAGRLLRSEPDRLLVGPDGHGGVFEALLRSGMLKFLREGRWDLLSHFQVDNPLVTVADPRYLGYHLWQDADFSCKVISKRGPSEGLGLAVLKSGRPAVIEYVDVPEEVAEERLRSGELMYRFGSIAIHIMDVPFAERMAHRQDALPWHVAEKQYEIVSEEGEKVETPPDGCRKFERFVFDALRFAEECAFVEVGREEEFAPVKNAEGKDSPQTARERMQQVWLDWLEEAGADIQPPPDPEEPVVEISPLYAADLQQLKDRVEPGWQPSFPLVLEP